jgi:hypothetical protein
MALDIELSWEKFKAFVISRDLDMLMFEETSSYLLVAVDTGLSLSCVLLKDNGTDHIDFENNFKSLCNPDKQNKDEMIGWGKFKAVIDSSQYDEEEPYEITVKFPENLGYEIYNFFGSWVHVENYGDNDYVTFQLVDVDNILDYGANTVLKEYCQLWSKVIEKTTEPIYAPNKSPGKVPAGLYAKLIYYPTDITKTNIKFWGKLVATVNT